MSKFLYPIALSLIGLLGLAAGYQYLKSQVTSDIYRDRLAELNRDYHDLVAQYNEAVRKTAVTELLVANGEVCVVIRTIEGELKRIQTPYQGHQEIYVDYVELNGRLWIRRVFDQATPPDKGVLIDPKLAAVDWDAATARHGRAVYRRLGEGRWVVTVTGDGSLGLSRIEGTEPITLASPPVIKDFPVIEHEIRERVDQIEATEVIRRMVR